MESNIGCYEFKKYVFTDGIFKDSVDATYILHLKGSDRLKSVEEQLKVYHPTNVVYIMFNMGYKKCNKKLVEQSSGQDLIDSNMQIFKHANHNNYMNILVLEDDFILVPDIKNPIHVNRINNFLLKKVNDNFIYQLGTVPLISFESDDYTYNTVSIGNHAPIYSRLYRDSLLKINFMDKTIIWGWDTLNNLYGNSNFFNKYAYYTPLCYQVFPMTKNREEWDNAIMSYIISNLYIDVLIEPGTSFMYLISLCVGYLFIFLFTFIIYYTAQYYYKIPKSGSILINLLK